MSQGVPSPASVGSRWAYIALGSNLGDSRAMVQQAVSRLQQYSDFPVRPSSLWESTPVDCPPGSGNFVNAVAALLPRSSETPESLLEKLQSLEKEFGRRRKIILNEPRPLDLDLILFGEETRRTDFLTLPHPRAHERQFVLRPLGEIAPDLIFPGARKTVRELLAALRTNEVLRQIERV